MGQWTGCWILPGKMRGCFGRRLFSKYSVYRITDLNRPTQPENDSFVGALSCSNETDFFSYPKDIYTKDIKIKRSIQYKVYHNMSLDEMVILVILRSVQSWVDILRDRCWSIVWFPYFKSELWDLHVGRFT
jgi:hypothetical protein